jgi:thioredoxin-related protein
VAAPVVDRIEKNLKDNAEVIRLNVYNPISAELASSYHIRAVPTLIVFNGDGRIAYREVGIPDHDHILKIIDGLVNNQAI